MTDLREQYLRSLPQDKMRLATLSMKEKIKIVDKLVKEGKISQVNYFTVIHNLEDYKDLIGE